MKLARALTIFAAACCVLVVMPVRGLTPQTPVAMKATGAAGYSLTKQVPLPDDGTFDYLAEDAPNRRLYVSHSTEVLVLDMDSLAVVGKISPTPGVHGIAISDADGHGFTSNGGGPSVTMFDIKTLQTIKTIPSPKEDTDGIIYDPSSDRIFVFCGDAQSALVIDAKTGDIAGTIDLGGGPEFAAADGRGHVYNVLEDKSELLDIDAKSMKVLARWPLAPCESPSGVAIDAAHHRVFAGCRNQVMAIVNTDTGKVIDSPKIGQGVDAARFDPGTQLAFASNGGGDGSITVIHEDSPDKFTVLGDIVTQPGARTMAVDTKTHTLYSVIVRYAPPAAPAPGSTPPAGGRRGGRRTPIPGSFTLLVITK